MVAWNKGKRVEWNENKRSVGKYRIYHPISMALFSKV